MHSESSLIGKVFFALCKKADTPISLGLWLRFKYDQKCLAEFKLPVKSYPDAYFRFFHKDRDSFRLDLLCSSFLSKWKGLQTGIDLEKAAALSFTNSEDRCLLSNERIRELRLGGEQFVHSPMHAVFFTARRKLSLLLGAFHWEKVRSGYGWGPGSTTDLRLRQSFVDTKMCKLPIPVSSRALPFIRNAIETDLHWSAALLNMNVEDICLPYSLLMNCFSLEEECVVEYVPKSAKTHRTIAKENRGNGFLQKGFGAYFRRRLKRVGINLDDQRPNQRGASRAYEEGLATLDLQAASDSICKELVSELLPPDWAYALDLVRSHRAVMPSGEKITLQKFSSMGNGFTFELETLIFWALASSVISLQSEECEVLVYGDDIIIPAKWYDDVVATLSFCGFLTNDDKSFKSGAYYESCGKHYFSNEEVTPIYQKEEVTDDSEAIRLANRLLRYAGNTAFRQHRSASFPSGFDAYSYAAWTVVYRHVGHLHRFQMPFGTEGDDALIVPAWEFFPVPFDKNYGFRCRVRVSRYHYLPGNDAALLAEKLRTGLGVDINPFGLVEIRRIVPAHHITGARWVMPTGEFGLGT